MMGKFMAVLLLGTALIAGGAMYYLQVYAFYDRVTAEDVGNVQMIALDTGEPVPLMFENFQAIDSTSAPVRFRACFDIDTSLDDLSAAYVAYPEAEPLVAPRWFDCFDARALGAALETGEARAYLGTPDVLYGIDRVIAVLPDGRAFAWQQINRCGAVVFDGNPVPEDCPAPPEAEGLPDV